jgi:hypothetical protein
MNNSGFGLGFGLTPTTSTVTSGPVEYLMVDENADGIVDESSDQIIIFES